MEMLSNLQGLGEAKFRKMVELLKRGTLPTLIVQLIQDEWGDCCDLPPDVLAKQLESLRTALSSSAEVREKFAAEDNPAAKALGSSGHGLLNEVVELARDHALRVTAQLEKEQTTGCTLPATNGMIELQAKLLGAIQEMKFDLGIDTFMRKMPEDIRQALERQERINYENERKVFEAYKAAEEVLAGLERRQAAVRRDGDDAGNNASQPS